MKKAFIYRRGGLGDTLLTFPLAEILKKQGYRITFCGNSDYLIFGNLAGWIDEIISAEFFNALDLKAYDLKIVISIEGNLLPFPQVRLPIYLYYLQSLNLISTFSQTLPILSEIKPLSKRAILHPSSGSKKKNPPLGLFEKIKTFLEAEGYEVIFLLGPAEREFLNLPYPIFYTEDLLEVAKILKTGNLYFGNDSGISHLSAYLNISSYIFYGPTDEVIFRPLGRNFSLLYLELPCRPCFPKVCEERVCLDPDLLFDLFLKIWFRDKR